MKRKKVRSKHNDLLNYFIHDERDLSPAYVKKCERFLFGFRQQCERVLILTTKHRVCDSWKFEHFHFLPSQKYAISYVDGQLIKSNKTEQTIAWGQDFSSYGVNQYIDLNASVASGLPVTYSLSDATVAELAVTMQSSLQGWWKMDELSGSTMNDSWGSSRTGVIPTTSSALGSRGRRGRRGSSNYNWRTN